MRRAETSNVRTERIATAAGNSPCAAKNFYSAVRSRSFTEYNEIKLRRSAAIVRRHAAVEVCEMQQLIECGLGRREGAAK